MWAKVCGKDITLTVSVKLAAATGILMAKLNPFKRRWPPTSLQELFLSGVSLKKKNTEFRAILSPCKH